MLENAIDLDAARIKKIDSPVAGMADILVVPDLEAGNMLTKSLTFMANADAARNRAGRQGAHHSHESGRFGDDPARLVRCGGPGRRCPAQGFVPGGCLITPICK